MSRKQRLYEILERPTPNDRVARAWNVTLIFAILINVVAVIVETVPSIEGRYAPQLRLLEWISVIFFAAEYLLRLWAITCDPRFHQPITGRLRYAITPVAVLHLLSIAPSILASPVDLRFVRIVRVGRLLRAVRLARYSQALALVARVVARRRAELVVAVGVIASLLLLASCLMYFVEHDAQPEAFSSIPATMWWAITTLTTVGYGDVYPVTQAGRLLAGLVALMGIGAFALPTSILGAGFLAEFERNQRATAGDTCSVCGRSNSSDAAA